MQREENDEAVKDERERKRAQKREDKAEQAAEESQRKVTRAAATAAKDGDKNVADETGKSNGRGRGQPKKPENTNGKISSYFKKEDVEAKAAKGSIPEVLQETIDEDVKMGDVGVQNLKSARQPSLLTGGTMRQYQLEGLEWLKSLYENGLNGILADEMGLGKTIQTISFLAFLREMETYGPFLIVAPLSTTTNWVDEFNKWTPSIPVTLYHGTPADRESIRKTQLKNPESPEFPVLITSYEICMNDRKHLANFGWKFIIIDEGHRIKNFNCRLIRELQSYQSANRLLITGTPLQNNLTELWSLLHFLMPDVFDKLESFESWFDFTSVKDRNSYEQIFTEERKHTLVASLHAILKPFLLRRVKTDVEKLLPKKREYVLFAPLTTMQRELYQAILDGTSRSYLEDKVVERLSTSGTATPVSTRGGPNSLKRQALDCSGTNTPNKSAKSSRSSTPASTGRGVHRTKRKNYKETSDNQYFTDLANHDSMDLDTESSSENEQTKIEASTFAIAKRQIAGKKLQNPVMQLRLCCDSPYNFFNPFLQPDLTEGAPDESLVQTSGKMLLLDTLLPELFREGHKVLIFSQFKTQLDLLQSYATMRGWLACRIDGGVPQSERADQIREFNTASSVEGAINLFLLSTRAGGQGINLAAADTVILFDSDWNPQQDLQAQDRAHRIGQTRNVIVYRLATRGTVEQTLLETAEGKRRLEKLVIRKGGLREDVKHNEGKDALEELQRLLRRNDGERFELDEGAVLTPHDLAILTDRSDEAYERAEKGLDAGDAFQAVDSHATGGSLLESLKA
jgi:ATP-dependent DNA helicase